MNLIGDFMVRVSMRVFFLIVALVCFILAALNVGGGKINLTAAGLAFLTGSMFVA